MTPPPPDVSLQTLPKVCNEALILSVLGSGPRHGYEIALETEARSGGAFPFRHGTLYPHLHRLEADGLIAGEWSDEGPRGKRRSYVLTAAGRAYADAQRAALRQLFTSLFAALDGATSTSPEELA